jgi:hypothetical protein
LAVLVSVAVLSGQRCAKQNQVRSFAEIGNKGISSLRVQVLGHFEGQGQIEALAKRHILLEIGNEDIERGVFQALLLDPRPFKSGAALTTSRLATASQVPTPQPKSISEFGRPKSKTIGRIMLAASNDPERCRS